MQAARLHASPPNMNCLQDRGDTICVFGSYGAHPACMHGAMATWAESGCVVQGDAAPLWHFKTAIHIRSYHYTLPPLPLPLPPPLLLLLLLLLALRRLRLLLHLHATTTTTTSTCHLLFTTYYRLLTVINRVSSSLSALSASPA